MGRGTIFAVNTTKAIYCSPAQAEAVAALLVVSSAALLVYKYVHFKGDAKIIIDCINDLSLHLDWEFQTIIAAIGNFLPCYSEVIYSFCPRPCNGVAHNWARWASFCKTWGTIPISHRGPLLSLMCCASLLFFDIIIITPPPGRGVLVLLYN